MRRLLTAALLLAACTTPPLDPPPDFAVPDLAAPDLATEDAGTCGGRGDPCCRDVGGRLFCQSESVCIAGRCEAPPPDLAVPPDLRRAPGTLGGGCDGSADCQRPPGGAAKCEFDSDTKAYICCQQATDAGAWRCY